MQRGKSSNLEETLGLNVVAIISSAHRWNFTWVICMGSVLKVICQPGDWESSVNVTAWSSSNHSEYQQTLLMSSTLFDLIISFILLLKILHSCLWSLQYSINSSVLYRKQFTIFPVLHHRLYLPLFVLVWRLYCRQWHYSNTFHSWGFYARFHFIFFATSRSYFELFMTWLWSFSYQEYLLFSLLK